MGAKLALIAIGTFALSAGLTGVVKKVALNFGMVDSPNARSSHSLPTARGGGLAIALSVSAAALILRLEGIIDVSLFSAVLIGGGAIAALGLIDDRISLSTRPRIVVHVLAASFAVFAFGGMPGILWGDEVLKLGLAGDVLGVIAIVWMLNLFNFMDGIDGIAGSEAVFVALSGAWLTAMTSPSTTATALVVASASAGFLLWNWPPAKIFMGDVGSGYLGYLIAVLTIASARAQPNMLYVWLILSGTFVSDATVTLLRRVVRRERLDQPHRSHAYQRLAQRWNSHLAVTSSFSMINVVWLLPCAFYCATHADQSRNIAAIAFIPLLLIACACGGNERESEG